MPIYQIADLKVAMQPQGAQLISQCQAYLLDASWPALSGNEPCHSEHTPERVDPDRVASPETVCDFTLDLPADFLQQQWQKYPYLSLDDCEYLWLGTLFYQKLLAYNGFLLHASAIAYEQRAYLFTANCGVGKSTHAQLWASCFGPDKVQFINDDKPAIRLMDRRFWVYGTPFSGKTDLNSNIRVPLHAICLLEQADHNWIRPADHQEAFAFILQQTIQPRKVEWMDRLLELLDCLLRTIPIYRLGCTPDLTAAAMAYQVINEEGQPDRKLEK